MMGISDFNLQIKVAQLKMTAIINYLVKKHLWVFCCLLVLSLLPILIFQQHSYINIHDNLDGEVPVRVALVNSGSLFNYQGKIDQIMNGLPRSAISTGLNSLMLLFNFFPPFTAYMINYLLVHIIAFIGMYLLLRKHILKDDNLIASGVAFCFSFLPFYSIFGLSIAGLPILLYSFLNIRSNNRLINSFLIISLFPFFSSLVLIGLFILVILGVWVLIDTLKRRLNIKFFLAIFLLGVLYLITEWNLIYSVFDHTQFISHRTDWINWLGYTSISFLRAIKLSLQNFISGQYHAVSLHKFILFLLPLTLVIGLITHQNVRKIVLLVLLCILFSLSFGFAQWRGLNIVKEQLSAINQIQARFYWISPLLWYMIFALSLNILYSINIKGIKNINILIIVLCLSCQILRIGIGSPELLDTISVAKNSIIGKPSQVITYEKFYSEKLFTKIKEFIGEPQSTYRVVSIGIFPAISQYNGFYTLDSYQTNYPLEYKNKFRKIIERELAKNKEDELYFDSWGSRCYIFSSEINSFIIDKTQSIQIKNLQLNNVALKEILEGRELYVFSAVDILNYKDNDLDFLGYFENNDSPWGIYLYRLNDPKLLSIIPN
jgi:hypothetical protein